MMKKITLAALFAATATFAGTFETWNGANGNPQIQTGLGNWTETFGYWFFYTDKNDGGGSNIAWPAMMDPPYYEDFGPVILECKGICGTAVLKGGSAIEKPFVGFGFSVVGETSDTDHTEWLDIKRRRPRYRTSPSAFLSIRHASSLQDQ